MPFDWIEGVDNLTFKGFFSMIDAAFLNYRTHNVSHWRCSICHLLPREFRIIVNGDYGQLVAFPLDELAFSILHFPLRIGDHLLKIAYHQDFKRGRMSEPFRKLYARRKRWVQYKFKKKPFSVLVDIPKANGSGNSNCVPLWRQEISY